MCSFECLGYLAEFVELELCTTIWLAAPVVGEIMELTEEMTLETDEKKFDNDCMNCTMPLKKLAIEPKISNTGACELLVGKVAAASAMKNPIMANNMSEMTK
jgi:hypothetical protein